MADKETAAPPGVKPTAEPGDEPATAAPDQPTMDPNSAAVSAYRHPLEPAPEAPDAETTAAPKTAKKTSGG